MFDQIKVEMPFMDSQDVDLMHNIHITCTGYQEEKIGKLSVMINNMSAYMLFFLLINGFTLFTEDYYLHP